MLSHLVVLVRKTFCFHKNLSFGNQDLSLACIFSACVLFSVGDFFFVYCLLLIVYQAILPDTSSVKHTETDEIKWTWKTLFLFQIQHMHIAQVEKQPLYPGGSPLQIRCKNFMCVTFVLPRERDCHDIYTTLQELSRPGKYIHWRFVYIGVFVYAPHSLSLYVRV